MMNGCQLEAVYLVAADETEEPLIAVFDVHEM